VQFPNQLYYRARVSRRLYAPGFHETAKRLDGVTLVWRTTIGDRRDRVPFCYPTLYLEPLRDGWEFGSVDCGSVDILCYKSTGKYFHIYSQSTLGDKDLNMAGEA
jgi:hypothetical protein